MSIPKAKILSQETDVEDNILTTEYFFEVPRDYANSSSEQIQLFARSARPFTKPVDPPTQDPNTTQRPWLLYLQGGPGFECGLPHNIPMTKILLEKGYQILYLDQRGTGRSSAISQSSLQLRGDEEVQAAHLKLFRADSIVKDCEAVRQALTAEYPEENGGKKWSIMGQSFGGFCCLTYLSFFPEGVKEAFIFGGLPPARKDADEVYDRLYTRMKKRNEAYYAKYPKDEARVKRICQFLSRFGDETVRVQGGEGFMTAQRFLGLGIGFGRHGGYAAIHDLVLRADTDLTHFGHITRPTVLAIEAEQSLDTNILYALLHEAIYMDGPERASNWSAHRLLSSHPSFALDLSSPNPYQFTGEMIYPWMFTSYPELRKLAEVGEMLAQTDDWGRLYDWEVLGRSEVPVYAAVYYEDMYVDFELSMETARRVGAKVFLSNKYEHNAIRARTEEVLREVFRLRDEA